MEEIKEKEERLKETESEQEEKGLQIPSFLEEERRKRKEQMQVQQREFISTKRLVKKIATLVITDIVISIALLIIGAVVCNFEVIIQFYQKITVENVITIAIVVIFLASHIFYLVGKRCGKKR